MATQEMLLTPQIVNRLLVFLLVVFLLSLSSWLINGSKIKENTTTDAQGFKCAPWHYTLGHEISFSLLVLSGLPLLVLAMAMFVRHIF